MNCANKQCNKEIQIAGSYFFEFAGKKISVCSSGCYMFMRLLLEHPKLDDFKAHLLQHHPRWIDEMRPFLDKGLFEPEVKKLRWWKKIISCLKTR